MSAKAKKPLVPRLRFPEFRDEGEWEKKKLGDICGVLQGYGFPIVMQGNNNGKYPFCKVSDISKAVIENNGLLRESMNYINDDDIFTLRAKLIPIGSTVFAKIGEALRLNRRAFVNRKCLIDNNAVGLKGISEIADDYFIYLTSQLIDLNKHYGGAVPSVSKSTLEAIIVIIPNYEEQQKIAACLTALDDIISAATGRLDALKQHKQGLMQQLFPAQGETVPRLRFAEFLNEEAWSERKLGEIGNFVSGGTPSTSNPKYWDGNIQWYTPKEIKNRMLKPSMRTISKDGLKNSSAKLLPKGAILITTRATIGDVAIANKECATNQGFQSLVVNETEVNLFWYYWILLYKNELIKRSSGSTFKEIRKTKIEVIPTFSPNKKEQQKIAACLAALDDLISAQTQKIAKLKTHKRGLMQQLFPAVDETHR